MRKSIRLIGVLLLALGSASCLLAQPTENGEVNQQQIVETANQLANDAVDEVGKLDLGPYSGENGILLAEGDSWFDYPFYDVLTYLEGVYQYEVVSTADGGDTLESIAYDPGQLAGLALKMRRLRDKGGRPRAILLSGGGNDIAGRELSFLLNHKRSGLPKLDGVIVSRVFDVRLRTRYLTLIMAVTRLSEIYFEAPIPVLIHGYDYPVPDGRGYLGGRSILPGPWFKPFFEEKGYDDQQENKETLKELVDHFNSILRGISSLPGYEHVCYVKVVGTLSTELEKPGKYDQDWGNELHPTRSGFRAVAARFQEALEECAFSM